ncbi:MAG TPA: amidohydrolase [Myxococcales bacterium]|nr:amidohydrolase [Deltaproteobacteria bacterium]HAA55106.1 amidohydrolase [Myxococcales bacterium]|tara:strand:- start:1129 stop:2844 length:1716 start_codon:yes stop_codon:yes gene_type:complete
MYDLVIRNGRVVDGTGSAAFEADIAIEGNKIVGVGQDLGPGKKEIDAKGMLVTPGWVDMHTHFDGQVTWDPYFTPSGWHGVTTVVMGNCGVGFAPCKKEDRDWLINVMEGVEDIPGSALSEGIKWDWETFPEYMDALEREPHAIDFATQIPHSAIRGWVMGQDRSEHEDATPEDIEQMRVMVEEALEAGALGFSTSRTSLHKTAQGVLVAGTHAKSDELFGIAQALKNTGKGVFECASEHLSVPEEFLWMKDMAEEIKRPVVFNLSQIDDSPQLWSQLLELLDDAANKDIPVYAQCAGRAIGIVMSWQATVHPFVSCESWLSMMHDPWESRREKLLDPEFRAKLLAEEPYDLWEFANFVTRSYHKMFPMKDGSSYEPDLSESVAERAKRENRDPRELAMEMLMENDGTGMMYFPLFNYSDNSLDALRTMHMHHRTRMGLSDGGAHCGAICDAGMPTFMLTHWTRDRKRGETMPLEYVIMRQTKQTAEFYGMKDRGVLAPGYLADVNIIDYDNLNIGSPKVVYDLPAGGRRLLQRATGYKYTIKSGTVIFEDGEATGEMPGTLIRGEQPSPE